MDQDYLISNSTYNILRRVVTIILPGLAILYAALSAVWEELPNSEAVVVTLAVLALLGGLLLSLSAKSWRISRNKYDGELITVGNDPDTGLPSLQLNITRDPSELTEKSTVYLRSIDQR